MIFTNVCKALQHLQTGTAARGKGQCWKLLCTSKAQRGLIYLSWISKYFFVTAASPPLKEGVGAAAHTGQAYNHIHRLPVFLSTLSGFDRMKAEQREGTWKNSPPITRADIVSGIPYRDTAFPLSVG